MTFLPRLSVLAIVSFVLVSASVAQDDCPAGNDPDVFYEDCFQRSLPVPPDVVQTILETNTGKQGLSDLSETQRTDVGKLFSAREVRLGQQSERDLIVMGKGPMSGADNTWFWLVRILPDHPRAVLWVGANGIGLLKSNTNGFRDVRSGWCSAAFCETKAFRFERGRYKCVRTRLRPNK